MQPQSLSDHQQLLTDVIKKQIVILGPSITLAKARNVPGLSVADDGTVTQITGDPNVLTQQLIEQFMELSGLIVKKTMEPLLAAQSAIQAAPATPPAPVMPVAPTPPMPVMPAVQPTPTMQTPVLASTTPIQPPTPPQGTPAIPMQQPVNPNPITP